MPEKIELSTAPPQTITETETKTLTRLPEFPEERASRIRIEERKASGDLAFRIATVLVYIGMIILCAYYLNDPKLGDFAQRTIVPMVAALAAFAVGRSIK